MRKLMMIIMMVVTMAAAASAKTYCIGWVETDAAIVETMWSVKEELGHYGIENFSLVQIDDEEMVAKATSDLKHKLYVEGVSPKHRQWLSVVESNGEKVLRVGNFKNANILSISVYKVISK